MKWINCKKRRKIKKFAFLSQFYSACVCVFMYVDIGNWTDVCVCISMFSAYFRGKFIFSFAIWTFLVGVYMHTYRWMFTYTQLKSANFVWKKLLVPVRFWQFIWRSTKFESSVIHVCHIFVWHSVVKHVYLCGIGVYTYRYYSIK